MPFHLNAFDIGPNIRFQQFDDLVIETDSIVDHRPDRVMPLVAEGQVLMCRLMRNRLKQGDLVLDIGTGSGVFAIWAAKKCGCRVVAIDVSHRAIRFSRRNCGYNGVKMCRSLASLLPGSIHVVHDDIERYAAFALKSGLSFGAVLLNPPFNPTCPLVKPALHAAAGPYGQTPFHKQIALVPNLLRTGGYCVGHQMSHDRHAGRVDALDVIREAFHRRCRVEFANVLCDRKQFPVDRFLSLQYAKLLSHPDRRVKRRVQSYIKRVSNRGKYFSLIYYDIQKTANVCRTQPVERLVAEIPDKGWDVRIQLHKSIVENAQLVEG